MKVKLLYAILLLGITIGLYLSSTKLEVDVIEKTPKLTICSWNIQNFGEKKARNDTIINQISNEIEMCDIVAIQEISNIHEKVDENCTRTLKSEEHKNYQLITKSLKKYLSNSTKILMSDQVKDERYAFLYNSTKLELIDSYIVYDEKEVGQRCSLKQNDTGIMMRQPFVAHFKIGNITNFTFLNIHTSPKNNREELEGLHTFYQKEKQETKNDIMILGDLNADCYYVKEDWDIKLKKEQFVWLIGDDEDTTTSKSFCAYDRAIITQETNKKFKFKTSIHPTQKEVSDHSLVMIELY